MQKNTHKDTNRVAVFGSLRVMAVCSFFVAISIVCGKYLAIPISTVLRLSFENLSVILAGIAFGPIAGASVGVVADLVGCLLVGYEINPLITVGAGAIGLVSGVVYKICSKLPTWLSVSLTVVVSHVIGSVLIKTCGLAAFYSMPLFELMLWRSLNYIIVGTLEGIIICAMMKNRALRKQLGVGREGKR